MGKVADNITYHLVDTTAILVATHPIYATIETLIAGMPDETSMKARLIVSAANYAGIGLLFSRGRDFSRKKFSITENTKEKTQIIHDMVYASPSAMSCTPLNSNGTPLPTILKPC